jgi:hypothetical protein
VTVCDGAVSNQKGEYGTTATGRVTAGWRRSRILSSPRDTPQGDQWKTAVNGNNHGSGRALDDENVDNDDNGPGGGGLALMIVDEDNQAGVATGDERICLHSRLIRNNGIGWGAGIRCSIHSKCIVTFLFQSITISFRVNYYLLVAWGLLTELSKNICLESCFFIINQFLCIVCTYFVPGGIAIYR